MEVNRNVLFPNLITIGNGICGFAALALIAKAKWEPEAAVLDSGQLAIFATASWLVLLGMVFDVFDGKVARLVGGGSPFGAMLDSLCDLVTFGLVPAVMIWRLGSTGAPLWWQRAVWFFSLAYFLGALLRLARFTAESEPDDSAHLAFKGLPTPGAAGCVASLVIFSQYILDFKAKELLWLKDLPWVSGVLNVEAVQQLVAYIPKLLPVLGLVLGFTMVSNRLIFDHLGSRIFSKRHSFDFFVYLVFGAILVAIIPEPILPVLFLGYLVYTPAKFVFCRLSALAGRGGSSEEDPRKGEGQAGGS